ncbi:MAG: flagellar biosynthetic protein FliO [Planctomycetota bacterium]
MMKRFLIGMVMTGCLASLPKHAVAQTIDTSSSLRTPEFDSHEPVLLQRGFPTLAPATSGINPHRTTRIDSHTDAVAVPGGGSTQLAIRQTGQADANDNGKSLWHRLQNGSTASIVTVGSSLAIVLALFGGLVWVSRRFSGGRGIGKSIPGSVVKPIGHAMLDPRTKLMLIQCGRRVLVVCQTTSGISPISEVTDPDEIRELVAACQGQSSQEFANTIRQIEREPIAGGFAGTERRPAPKKLFATA